MTSCGRAADGGGADCWHRGGACASGALVQVAVVELLHGDCRTVMAGLPAASVDADYIAIARARIAHAVQSPAQQPLHI